MRPALERAIRLPQAVALVVGTIVGVAIFIQPAEVARRVASPVELLAVWIVAGLVALAGALVCCELASGDREEGGVVRYLAEAYGPATGFLWNWALFWAIHSAILAAIATVFARSLLAALPAGGASARVDPRALAVVAIAALTAVNFAGVRHGAGLQVGLTVAKVLVLLGLAAIGIWLGAPADSVPAPAAATAASADLPGAVFTALFAFGGWHLVTFPARETVEPRRTLPRAIVLGFALVVAVYVALHVAYLRLLPLAAIAESTHVAADAAEVVAGGFGRTLVAGVAALSALATLNGLILVGPRSYLAAAREGAGPRRLGAVHGRFRTPHAGLLAQAVWAGTLAVAGSYRTLYGLALGVEWFFFALLGVAVILLRRRPPTARRAERRFSIPGYPIVPLAFAAVALALVASRALSDPRGSLLGLLLVASGLPVYWLGARRRLAALARS